MDGLITLLIFVGIAVISAILKKRGEPPPEEQYPDLPRFPKGEAPPPPPVQRRSWEDELRDLLNDQQPQPPPPPPVYRQPPPLVYTPPPVPVQSGPVHREELYHRDDSGETYTIRSGFANAEERMSSAAHLHEQVAKHFADMGKQKPMAMQLRQPANPESRHVTAMLRDGKTLRTAILAQVILGPPRSLEESLK